MKILFCIDAFRPSRGGAERYLADLAFALDLRGHAVAVAAAAAEEAPGVFPIRIAAPQRPRLVREAVLARVPGRFRRAGKFDVVVAFRHALECDLFQPHGGVHIDSLRGAVRAASASGLARKLLLARKLANPKHLFFVYADRVLLGRADPPLVAALSEMSAAGVRRVAAGTPTIAVAPNGVDGRRYHPGLRDAFRAAVLRELHVPESSAVALFCGHNFALKGLREALLGAAACGRAGVPVHLLVAGRGAQAGARRLARRLGLEEHVRFLGDRADMHRLLGAADLLLHPTWYDPCSLVVLEALGAGVPVITTRFNGAAELMESGREGLVLADPRDAAAMAQAVSALLGAERARFREAAAARGRELDFQTHVSTFESLCRAAQERRGMS